MRTLLPLTIALLSLFWFPAMAGEFSRVVPADSSVYVEVLDVPQLTAKQKETPFGKALSQLDWKKALIQFAEVDDPGIPSMGDEQALREVLDQMERAYLTVSEHLTGSWAMAIGDFTTPFMVFREHQDLRSEWMLNEMVAESLEEEENDPLLQEQLERERTMDLKELAAILGEVAFYADIQDVATLQGTLEAWAQGLDPVLAEMKNVTYRTRTYQGVTLYELSYSTNENLPSIGLHWCFTNDTWVTTMTSAAMERALNQIMEPPAVPLASNPDFQAAYPPAGTSDSFTFFNLPLLHTWFKMALEEAGDLPETGNLNAEKMLNWLGLDALLPITQTTQLSATESITNVQMGFRRETGLSRLLLSDPEPIELPSMLHRDMGQFTAASWSIGDFWTRLETELMGLAPEAAAGIGMVRMLATGQLGFDIKLQFFDHLDTGVIFIQTLDPEVMKELNAAMASENPEEILAAHSEHPTGGQNYLIGFETKNEDQIRMAMDRLLTRFFPAGAPEPEVLQGIEIMNPLPPGIAGGMIDELVHFAFVDGWLLISIGERALLHQAIEASQDEALQLRKLPNVQALRAKLPADAFQLQYASGKEQEQAMQMATASFQMIAPEGMEVPDLSFFADLYEHMLQATTRDGLLLKVKSVVTFQE